MRMLPVLVLFLVSRARELVRKLCEGGDSQDSSGVSVIDTETGREIPIDEFLRGTQGVSERKSRSGRALPRTHGSRVCANRQWGKI